MRYLLLVPCLLLAAGCAKPNIPEQRREFAYYAAQGFVEDRLRTRPVEFPPYDRERVTPEAGDRFYLRGVATAPNAFGVRTQHRWACRVQWTGPEDAVYTLEDLVIID